MKRTRQHLGASYYLPASALKYIPQNYPPLIEQMDWSNVFINGKPPAMIDLGCGKGLFLEELGKINPNKNILGIELRKSFVQKINDKIKELRNVYALWYNISNGLEFLSNSTIEKIFFLFPDPWFKKKHFKRRVFNIELLNELNRILRQDGAVYIATDIYEVHKYHIEKLYEFNRFKIIEDINSENWDLPMTNKQKSCEDKVIDYYRLICRK